MANKHWIPWFEIPSADFERACGFYETIFDMKLEIKDLGALQMGLFPERAGGGAIVFGEWYKPSASDGILLYLNANPDMNAIVAKIEPAGGQVLRAKTLITPELGYMALFEDTEGNRMGLRSMG